MCRPVATRSAMDLHVALGVRKRALAVAAALSSGTLAARREADSRLHGHPPPPRRPGIIPSQKLWGRRAVVRARRVKPSGAPWAPELRALVRVPGAW